ncbi:DUF1493 family protein [Paraglaciecola sp. 2405UD69-4]|uniref:DUF1493 family protein n=1 Tax=Paraglaciecola sp. 2405UD69-4 TaxID=3391836 RepID=UPI0039C9AE20
MDITNILNFVACESGIKIENVNPNTDISEELGIVGDDFHELIEAYAIKYHVNMEQYLWYFHTQDEAINIWAFIFKPPWAKVKRIPVTPQILFNSAIKGEWQVIYPVHEAPTTRNDITYSNILWLLLIIGMVLLGWYS